MSDTTPSENQEAQRGTLVTESVHTPDPAAAAPPQYSPDGRFWWNGHQWLPVELPGATPAIEPTRRWYQAAWLAMTTLVLFFPVGLFLMWRYQSWNKAIKWGVTGLWAVLVVAAAASPSPRSSPASAVAPTPTNKSSSAAAPTASATVPPTAKPTAEVTPTPTSTPPPTPTPTPAPTTPPTPAVSNLTEQQQNAAEVARQYLSTQGFLRQGLIDQLSSSYGDGYSVNDATVAVDSLDVDWNAEAVQAAKDYLKNQPFSCNGLIQQLDSSAGDKFTVAQATYGAHQAGAC